MSIKYNFTDNETLDKLLTEQKSTSSLPIDFERVSFEEISKILASFLDKAIYQKPTELVDNIDCFVYLDEEQDFDVCEKIQDTKLAKEEQEKELKRRFYIRKDNLDKLVENGCAVSKINAFISEILHLSFYGYSYDFDAEVDDISHNLKIKITDKKLYNNTYEIEKEKLLSDKNVNQEDAQKLVANLESKINIKEVKSEEVLNKRSFTLEVKEMSIDDAFTSKKILSSVMMTKSVCDGAIMDFLSKRVLVNGTPFKEAYSNISSGFYNFLQGRLILLYQIIWQVVRFAYCYNRKKKQFLPTII